MTESSPVRVEEETQSKRDEALRILMTVQEAAIHWRRHRDTIRRWCNNGHIPAEAIINTPSGRKLIDVLYTEDHWKEHKRPGRPPSTRFTESLQKA